MDYKNLFFTGFMGAGKSVVGAALAQRLDMRHTDLDAAIEQEFAQSVFALFNLRGEEEFRRLEKEMLKGLVRAKGMVVSLGGGTFLDPECREVIHEEGLSIYLKATPEFLTNRLYLERHQRPLLHKLNKRDELAVFVEHLLNEREPAYQLADFTVVATNRSTNEIVEEICTLLEKSNGR